MIKKYNEFLNEWLFSNKKINPLENYNKVVNDKTKYYNRSSKRFVEEFVELYKKYWNMIYDVSGNLKVSNPIYKKLKDEFLEISEKLQMEVLAIAGRKSESSREGEELSLYVAVFIQDNSKTI